MLGVESGWRCGGVGITSVAVNCLVYRFIFTLVPLPNESPVALLSSLLPVGLPLCGVHGVGCRSPHCAWHLLHRCLLCVAPGGALGLLLFPDGLHAAWRESLCLPNLVHLGGWALWLGVPGAAALGGHDGLVDPCVGSSHGVHLGGLELVAGLRHGAGR